MSFVTDYSGKLIPKNKSRRIKGEDGKFNYYEIGTGCVKMPDGIYYRTTTGKIIYDHSKNEWVFSKNFQGSKGLVYDGTLGYYSDTTREVTIMTKKDMFVKKLVFNTNNSEVSNVEESGKRWQKGQAVDEEVAAKFGFVESIYDGCFYKFDECTSSDLSKIKTPNIPQSEKTNTYSLDDDKEYRKILEEKYDANNIKVPANIELFSKKYIPFTWGCEIEIQNGFLPKRVREPLGFRVCRDGSLDGGQEYVSIPMQGGKGIITLRNVCEELTKRCAISNKCSVHIHFGDVRRDKLYILSLWHLFFKIQDNFRKYFPFSRTNSIREDGKVYANLLPDLGLNLSKLMTINNDEEFKSLVNSEFSKIYKWLNHGHDLGETFASEFVKETKVAYVNNKPKKLYCYRVKDHKFTTAIPKHAVQGRKWERKERYLAMNIMNLFFSNSRTVEMRIHEATTNFDKIFCYLLICVAILKYAENFKSVFSNETIKIDDIIKDHFPEEISNVLIDYLNLRKAKFCNINEAFKSGWKQLEEDWFASDNNFKLDLKL